MSTDNHRLVILGSMDEFVDLVECAKKRGIYTIVCDGYEDGPAKAHADKAYLEDVRHTDAIAEICRKEQADGIIASFSDLLAECMIDIADAAGLYFHGHDGEVADTSSIDELGALPGVVEYRPYYRTGDTISHERGAKPYVVRYYVAGPSRESVDSLSRTIMGRASVLDPDGNELLLRTAPMAH